MLLIFGGCASTGNIAVGGATSVTDPPGGPYCGTKIPPPSTSVDVTAKLSIASGQRAGWGVKGFVDITNNGSHFVRISYGGGGVDTVALAEGGTRIISTEIVRTFDGRAATLAPGKSGRYPIFLLSAKCPAPDSGPEPPLNPGTYRLVAIIAGATTDDLDVGGTVFTVSSAPAEVSFT